MVLIMIIIYMFSRGGHSCPPRESTTLLTLLPVFILASLALAFFYSGFERPSLIRLKQGIAIAKCGKFAGI
ncbi:hypothetical protein SOASR032_29230 [Pragia fontium]|uniref:Uncharacterized protein n=1 Tax=Pragia fontium TaxID=82985 RepID=A0ABQ5LM94_9GAMM|nr:hypothetical protein QQ39_01030 [Pragia fontium]GKX64354.1 hypothetical protein SOASR032_29230 [Pragia fontium]